MFTLNLIRRIRAQEDLKHTWSGQASLFADIGLSFIIKANFWLAMAGLIFTVASLLVFPPLFIDVSPVIFGIVIYSAEIGLMALLMGLLTRTLTDFDPTPVEILAQEADDKRNLANYVTDVVSTIIHARGEEEERDGGESTMQADKRSPSA